jgi:hypothetical protein
MPRSRSRDRTKAADPRCSDEDIEADKRELENLRNQFRDQPEQELDKLLADRKTQVRVGQVIGDSILFGRKKR